MEAASRDRPVVPSAAVLERMAHALKLDEPQTDELYFTAGRCPPSFDRLATWEPVLGSLARRLADQTLAEEDLRELRVVLGAIGRRWHAGD
jgi:hypothetical protein